MHNIGRYINISRRCIRVGYRQVATSESDLAGHSNERYDQYVIPLANAFRRSVIERLDQYSEIIEGLRIPVVVIGVGAQLDDRPLESAGYPGFSAFHRNHPERFDNYVRFLNNNGIDHILRGHREDSAAVRSFDRQIELARNKRPVSVSGGFGSAVSRKRKRLREVGAAILPRSRRKS